MKRVSRLIRIKEAGIVAVVRNETQEDGLLVSQRLLQSNIKGIEVTLTTPGAIDIIKELSKEHKSDDSVIIGAGTVMEKETATCAIMAGAEFIVSPILNKEISEVCHFYQIPYIPGCTTITEMTRALSAGADIIKLFPSHLFDEKIIATIKAPLPQINLMPSGGVNLSNISKWLKAGAIVVSVGGELTNINSDTEKLAEQYLKIADTHINN